MCVCVFVRLCVRVGVSACLFKCLGDFVCQCVFVCVR